MLTGNYESKLDSDKSDKNKKNYNTPFIVDWNPLLNAKRRTFPFMYEYGTYVSYISTTLMKIIQ